MAGARDVDESLFRRVSSLSLGEQRWLKLAIQALRTTDAAPTLEPETHEEPPPQPRRLRAANLEDVITGKANLREQLESYPELAGEMEGLAEEMGPGSGRRVRLRSITSQMSAWVAAELRTHDPAQISIAITRYRPQRSKQPWSVWAIKARSDSGLRGGGRRTIRPRSTVSSTATAPPPRLRAKTRA